MVIVTLVSAGFSGCAAPPREESSNEPAEDVGTRGDGLSGTLAAGTVLEATAGVNLRKGASTSADILYTIPAGSRVTVQSPTPRNGFYEIAHHGTVGWSHGQYYRLADGDRTSAAIDMVMARAEAGVGFSYWWGHARFHPDGPTPSTAGSCSGSCPDCSHSGSWGGDCSGFVAKVWQVPSSNLDMTVDSHPYSTADFNRDARAWSTVPREGLQRADALVYRTGGVGHIFLYRERDGWGSMYAYECRGCADGCVKGYRTASSAYHVIRRAGH